jgi:hypothetical protein
MPHRTPPPEEPTDGDLSLRDKLDDPGSYQSNHATTGTGADEDRADTNSKDAKVKGQSRG